MAHEPKTLADAIRYFSDVNNCIDYLALRRWPNGVSCPTCGRKDVAYVPSRRLWQCKTRHPKAQFSIKTGTILEESLIGLEKWLPVMWMVANCKNGVSSWEIHRALGVTQKTAWFMLHRIRLGMQSTSANKLGGNHGPVEADETFIGGLAKNMHAAGRARKITGSGGSGKTIVMGFLDRNAREVRAKVIPNVKRETLQAEVLANVDKRARVYTDSFKGYNGLDARFYVHEVVDHLQTYVSGQVHTQGIENFWSLLKRTLSGTYVAVEPFHLDRYVDEQVFRFNNRGTKDEPINDGERMSRLCSQIIGKRLTYAELTAKEDKKPEVPF